MKKIITSLLAASTFFLADAQQVINLLTGEVREGGDAVSPSCSISTLDDGYQVTWEFTEARLVEDREFDNTILWYFPDFRQIHIAGEPCISYEYDWLLIGNATPMLEVVDSSFVDFNYQLAPAFPEQPGFTPPYDRVERIPINSYEGFFPTHIVKAAGSYSYSESREAAYAIYPIQYNYEQQTVRAYTKIVYKVTLSGGTTGIEELKSKCDASKCSFTLDGCPVKGNVKGVTVRNGKKIIVK